jgi:hypothetical protein
MRLQSGRWLERRKRFEAETTLWSRTTKDKPGMEKKRVKVDLTAPKTIAEQKKSSSVKMKLKLNRNWWYLKLKLVTNRREESVKVNADLDTQRRRTIKRISSLKSQRNDSWCQMKTKPAIEPNAP